MPKIIQMPDNTELEFPDNMEDNQILSIINKQFGNNNIQPENKNLTWSEVGESALKNIPSSAVNMASGITEAITSPIETGKTIAKIGAGAVQKLTGGGKYEPYAEAVRDFFKERYGGIENIKETISKDPVGFAADLSSVLTGGGAIASKVPKLTGAASKISTVGKVIDPISIGMKTASKTLSGIGKGASYLAPEVLGVTTGAGSEAIKSAFEAGKVGEKSFLKSLRSDADISEIITDAKNALTKMKSKEVSNYLSDMKNIKNDKTILNFDNIDNAISGAIDRAQFKGQTLNKETLDKVNNAKNLIDNWKSLDPVEFHTPEGLDALKKQVGDILEDIPFEKKNARAAVGGIYNSIKDTINNQAPNYSKIMKRYEDALGEIKEIEKTLSLGNKASIDTALRKLQSVVKNNVQTNYGQRLNLVKSLEEKGGSDIINRLSGQSLSALLPRGLLSSSLGAGVGIGSIIGNPSMLLSAPLFLPRAVGEAAYGLGSLDRLKNILNPEILNRYKSIPRKIAGAAFQTQRIKDYKEKK